MSADMKLCPVPWCHGAARTTEYGPSYDHFHRVVCDTCFVQGPPKRTETDAIAAWNTRPTKEPS